MGDDQREHFSIIGELDEGFPDTLEDDLSHLNERGVGPLQQPQDETLVVLGVELPIAGVVDAAVKLGRLHLLVIFPDHVLYKLDAIVGEAIIDDAVEDVHGRDLEVYGVLLQVVLLVLSGSSPWERAQLSVS